MGEAVDCAPVRDSEPAGAGPGRLDGRLRHKHTLTRLEATRLEHPLRRLPVMEATHRATIAQKRATASS